MPGIWTQGYSMEDSPETQQEWLFPPYSSFTKYLLSTWSGARTQEGEAGTGLLPMGREGVGAAAAPK